jgi:transposase InsO family protein
MASLSSALEASASESTSVLDAAPETLAERLFQRALVRKPMDRLALRALTKATRLLSLALGQRLAEMRVSDDARGRELATSVSGTVLVHAQREIIELLGARLDKLPPRQRPHYTPVQRFRIIQIKSLLGLAQDEIAQLVRVSVATIAGWETNANPASKTVGSTVAAIPPVRRYEDSVHHLVQLMAAFGFAGYDTIAGHLLQAGWRLARSTVRRYLKEPLVTPTGDSPAPETPKRAVVARFPHHVWHLDLTEIPAFLGSAPRQLALVLDSFSRVPLAARLFQAQPTTHQMTAFVESAFQQHGSPRHLIVDRAGYFIASEFQEYVDARNVNLRFCSADHHRANSKLERFWGTLKHHLLDLRPAVPLVSDTELAAAIDRALRYYTFHRPHTALSGDTPAEALANIEPRRPRAVQPPRGRRGEPWAPVPFVIDFFEGDHRLPLLRTAQLAARNQSASARRASGACAPARSCPLDQRLDRLPLRLDHELVLRRAA